MGINKDPNYSAKDCVMAKREEELYPTYTEHDKKLITKMIKEVNSKGYYIEYLFQLSWMDKEDFEIIDEIILKFAPQFDCWKTSYGLYDYLAVRGNNIVTEYLLKEFKKENYPLDCSDWNSTRRGTCASVLEVIKDKSKIDEYIEVINNEETRQDTFHFILLLGELKVEKSIPMLIELLNEENISLQSAAIQALTKFKKKIDLKPIITPMLQSDNEVIREYAKKALK